MGKPPKKETARPSTWIVSLLLLASCAQPKGSGTEAEPAAPSTVMPVARGALADTIRLYVGKLADRSFTDVYGDLEEPKVWYIAAERLGQIRAPAVPHLVARLDSDDPHELMLALYALMLASQDSTVLRATGGEYVDYRHTVLTAETNGPNRERARAWWAKWGHLWTATAPRGR